MEEPHQFEVILDEYQNTKVEGNSLNGDIDFIFGRIINLIAAGEDLKTVFVVTPTIVAADVDGNTVEASVEIVISVYKYEHIFTDIDLYGLFCHAYIVFYHIITRELQRKNIYHNGRPYIPTKTIPSFYSVKEDIAREIKKVYG